MTNDDDRPAALFFGAVGTIAETSDLQRRAFNAAFAQSGLDWEWDEETYRGLLRDPGGVRRIEAEAQRREVEIDATAVHDRKVANFRDLVRETGLTPRPGVAETLAWARSEGLCVAWVTTTGRDTIDLILEGLGKEIPADAFDFICDRGDAARPKPAPDVYLAALERAGVAAGAARAVEDTPESAAAALSAGIPTLAMPGWAAAGRDFPGAADVVSTLSPAALR